MVSQYIQRQCAGFGLLLLALCLATPAWARDIVETPAALFFTRDEVPGIQMPTPQGGCCDTPINIFGTPENPIGPLDPTTFFVTTETDRYWLQPDDFTASSAGQFKNLGIQIGQEAVRTRLRPFLAAWMYDTNDDTLVVSDRALGPMLAERPQTMGKGRIAIGWSYQQVNWTKFEGQNLDSLRFKIEHKKVFRPGIDDDDPVTNPNRLPNQNRPRQGQELDFINVDVDFKLEQDYVDFYFEYGITDNWDVSVVVPIVQTNLEITAFAGLVQTPTDPSLNLTEPGVDLTFASFNGMLPGGPPAEPGFDPTLPPDTWQRFYSIRTHMFCKAALNETFRSLQVGGGTGCPGGSNDALKGDRAGEFFGNIRDIKDEKAIGIGDIRFRSKWHMFEANGGLIPDLAWIAEIRPPTGIEDDFQGTGALSTSNYMVTAWTMPEFSSQFDWVSGFRPHLNVGVEISAGPDWQDATEWAVGFEVPGLDLLSLLRLELRAIDWVSLSFDQLGRIPFGNATSRRYEYGGGIKLVPTPGSTLFFDFIKPINDESGLTAAFQWRVGGQVTF
jgi:hypothetical protein